MDHKILLIDDSAILRRIATNVLSAQAGCGEIITATRATEGFARACASGARLILVDHQIAGLPQADFCRRLLAEPRTSHVPVILLLSPGMYLPPGGTLPPNVVDHLVKPFTPEQLLGAVRNALGKPAIELPVKSLPAKLPPPSLAPPELLQAHHELALAMSTTATVRRETGRISRIHHAPVASRAEFAPGVNGGVGSCRTETARLRNTLVDAAGQAETGVLRVQAGSCTTEIYLESGRIVVVATHDARRYSEDAEGVVPPKVNPATLEDAVTEQASSGVPFFLALGSSGLVSKSAAVTLLHRFGQRYFARLWSVPTGTLAFEFEALDALPGFALRLEPRSESVDAWLLEASRNLCSKDVAGMTRHEGLGGVPRLQPGRSVPSTEILPLDDQEQDFVGLIDGRRSLAAIAVELGLTPEHAYLLLYRFRCLGIMDYRTVGSAFVVTPRTNVRRVLPLQR